MTVINQVMVEVYNVVERAVQNEGRSDSSQTTPSPSATTSTTPAAATTGASSSGPTSSPLLFFVALGFGVVFTNLWIIVGVKYCFRYNSRNRQIRTGEDGQPINLENMPRPHRRRREKKLMTMDEVNERFPLTKYKNWVASRAREGLPTSGGVTALPSRAGSLRNVDGILPSSPVGTKHSIDERPATAASNRETSKITISPATNDLGGNFGNERKSLDANVAKKGAVSETAVETSRNLDILEEVRTTTSTVDPKHATVTSEEEEEEEDDHIHTAVPPELLTNPGDSCAICIDTLEDDDDIRGLTCGHAFHAGCLDPWLTSRRACCPLCKADYYVPKPRPEGEVADAERSTRRANGMARMNMPQAPHSTWTGIRGSPRLILPARFITSPMYPGDGYGYNSAGDRRTARRSRRDADAQANAPAPETGAAENSAAAAPRSWRPRISNPFRTNWMPPMRFPGRARQAETNAERPAAMSPSPSQLEAGVR